VDAENFGGAERGKLVGAPTQLGRSLRKKPRNERRANALRRVQRLVRSAALHEPIAEHDKFPTIIGA